jgi:hypothetical protein
VLGYDDDAGEAGAEARRVVGEMDFFKTEKRKEEAADRSHSAAGAPDDLSINKDDLTINVRRWACTSAGGRAGARSPSSTMASPPTR